MRWSRWATGGAVAMVALLMTAPVAAADPARPGNARSTVTSVTPRVAGVRVDVVGGDGFLRVRVDRGHEVVVIGYEAEPYLRVSADGTVEQNVMSPAVYLNRGRYTPSAAPTVAADPKAPPRWERIGGDGTATWHDHRIHFMGTGRAPASVTNWKVPLMVDAQPVEVAGRLDQLSSPSSLPWWLQTSVVAALAGWVVLTATAWRVGVAAVGALSAVVVSVSISRVLPASAGGGFRDLLVPLILLLLTLAAAVAPMSWRRPVLVGLGAGLVLWAGQHLRVFSSSVLLSSLPEWLERSLVTVALGTGLALVIGVAAEMAGVGSPVGLLSAAAGGAGSPQLPSNDSPSQPTDSDNK